MPNPISPSVFEGFPNNDWESATPPVLLEAVLSVRKLTGDGFFRIGTLLKKQESLRREPRPEVSFGACYRGRVKGAQRAAREAFDAFLKIATTNRAIIDASPVAWAYGQTDALLRQELGSAQSLQEFHKIRLWIKEYCDGKDQAPIPAIQSDKSWKEYFCRESWRAPMWLRNAASRHFANDTSVRDDSDEQGFQRLGKEETETLLDGICRWFWSAVKATLENQARQESVNFASQAPLEPVTGEHADRPPLTDTPAVQAHEANGSQPRNGQPSIDSVQLSKGVREGKTVELLYDQLKRIRRLYRDNGWSASQIRKNTAQELAIAWEWIDRIDDEAHKSAFLRISEWEDGDQFIFLQIAALYRYDPHLKREPGWGTVRDWRKAYHGHLQHRTPDGRKPRP